MENRIQEILLKYWGYKEFRPFQKEAIFSILDSMDTLTVLPTGGGKSVCFQVPALIRDGMAVVISPLISLMKDQVDYLKDMGIRAECLNSSLDYEDKMQVMRRIRSADLKLLYLAPERLMLESMREFLKGVNVSFFVIDEAHCISHWGHDFRSEYRELGVIKEEFKGIAVHAFTATATHEVQQDIVKQLRLKSPRFYIGEIDRPNLTYRIRRRTGNLVQNIVSIIRQHPGEAGIIYCLRRDDVDSISGELNESGYKNLPYHAGMSSKMRRHNQDEFSEERVPIIVATIAFGMGIDRFNIRYIIHAAMPKSIEHYQQETGRAGRDGLPADCYMFYSGADYRTWEYLLKDSSHKEVMSAKLKAMYGFCGRAGCRHRYLVNYFSQEYKEKNCNACDYCLGEFEMLENPGEIARKILSSVRELGERFGIKHIADVLKGNLSESVNRWKRHQELPSFSLMQDFPKSFICNMIEQLIEQEFLARENEFKTLFITRLGFKVLSGEIVPSLAKPIVGTKKREIQKKQKIQRDMDWKDIDENLFEILRAKRRQLAYERNVPAYVIFGDKTLKDMARVKPVSMDDFLRIFGVGESKMAQYGEIFIRLIQEYLNPDFNQVKLIDQGLELKDWRKQI